MAEIRNPNHPAPGSGGSSSGGGDTRVTMAFMLFAMVAILGYQYFFAPKPTPPAPPQPTAQTQSQTPQQTPAQPAMAAAQAALPASAITAAAETETTIENAEYKITFTNRGAQVKHWILKYYKNNAGQPLDMVQPQTSAKFGLPLSLFTYEPSLTQQVNQALYQVTASGAPLSASNYATAPATSALTFHYSANGLDVLKTIHFDASYVITIENQVTRNGQPVRSLIQWPAGLGDMEEFAPGGGKVLVRTPSQFTWSLNGDQKSQAANGGGFLFWSDPAVSNNATFNQPYQYAAVTDLYFAAAFLPSDLNGTSVVTLHNTIDLPTDLSDPNSKLSPANVLGLAVGDQSGYTKLRLYAGPKQLDVLKTIRATAQDGTPSGPPLDTLIQFGWLTIIAKPLYLALRFLHDNMGGGINNWGWAIIIVTVIFNLLMLPTRIMMMRSSMKMMRIQPKVDAIKKRFANLKPTDPKRAEMNIEMMALYKEEGINMYGSCLPMLIQMPLFFAYYRVLSNAVELRQAHWFWLTDLSVADPLHILPILIITSMFIVQMMTPSPGMDPQQRRMMAFMMPVIFGFSMWHFASGLALYWATGNLINLIIQLSINQSPMGKEMHERAAKRAAKKTGTGITNTPRTIQGRR